MRTAILLSLLLLLVATPALAHADHEHVSDLQVIINGVGIILILGAAAHTLLKRR